MKNGALYWVQWNGSDDVEIGRYSMIDNGFYFIGDEHIYRYTEFKFTVLGEVSLEYK